MNHSIKTFITSALLPLLFSAGATAQPTTQSKSDWLITPPTQRAELTSTNNNKDLILSNGLFKRTFRLQPNLACTGFSNTTTGQELLRSIKAEARITINGKIYSVGGLHGQLENAYLVPTTIDTLKTGDNDFQYQSYTTTPLKPYLNWKPVGWAGNHTLPTGLVLIFNYRSNLPDLKGLTVQVHYEAYDGIPLLVKWLSVENKGTQLIRIDRVVNEILGVVEEESSVEGSKEQMATQHGLYIETNYAFNNAGVYHLSDQTTHWKTDSSYTSQVHYRYQTPCLLETYP